MNYSVQCIKLAEFDVRGPQVFWMEDWDRWYTLDLSTVVIRGGDVTAVVNTDLPLDLKALHDEFPSSRMFLNDGEPGHLRRTYAGGVAEALRANGIRLDEVTHLLLTPLEAHTTSAIPLFPRAQILLSKRGWVHFHTTHSHPHDQRWRSFTREVLRYMVFDAWDRVRLLDDEDEVQPGLRTWWSGVHHRASMVIEVDTDDGVVSISDAFWYYDNVTSGRALGHGESIEEALRVYDRVRRTAKHIIPAHDPLVYERYPDGWVVPRHPRSQALPDQTTRQMAQ